MTWLASAHILSLSDFASLSDHVSTLMTPCTNLTEGIARTILDTTMTTTRVEISDILNSSLSESLKLSKRRF